MHLPRRTKLILISLLVLLCSAIAVQQLTSGPTTLPDVLAQVEAPAEPPPPPPAQEPPALDAKSATILELFNPSDAALTHQLNDTEISQRIEQLFVASFVLVRCKHMPMDEYNATFRALIRYAGQADLAADAAATEARVRKIAELASASYSLVYHRTPCDDPKLPSIAEQMKTWRAAYQ